MRRLLGMLCAFVVVLMLGFSNQALAEDEVKNQEATNTKMTSTNNAVSQTVEANALSCNHDPLPPKLKIAHITSSNKILMVRQKL